MHIRKKNPKRKYKMTTSKVTNATQQWGGMTCLDYNTQITETNKMTKKVIAPLSQ